MGECFISLELLEVCINVVLNALPISGGAQSRRLIVWSEPWYRDSHNNIRVEELLSRFKLVEPIYQYRSRTGLRGRLRTKFEETKVGKYRNNWAQKRRLGALSKRYRLLFCHRDHLRYIQDFDGPVVVDDDDPNFTEKHIEHLNSANVVAVVTTTELLREQLIAHGLKKCCHVIPSGVDLSQLEAARSTAKMFAKELGKGPDDVVVGYTIPAIHLGRGSNVSENTFGLRDTTFLTQVMEQVWGKMPAVQLWLFGRVNESIKNYATLHPQVRLFGYVPHEQLYRYTVNFDIGVYPRLADFGGRFSIKLLEFMASGCPIVSTSVSESFLVSDSGGAMLADDVSTFSECIIQLASNPEMRRDLGQRGLEYAQGYDWNRLTERYEAEVFTPCLKTLST